MSKETKENKELGDKIIENLENISKNLLEFNKLLIESIKKKEKDEKSSFQKHCEKCKKKAFIYKLEFVNILLCSKCYKKIKKGD